MFGLSRLEVIWSSNFTGVLFSSKFIPFVLIGCISKNLIHKPITTCVCTLNHKLVIDIFNLYISFTSPKVLQFVVGFTNLSK